MNLEDEPLPCICRARRTHVTGPTVETHNRRKQETKGNLRGASWSSILALAVLNLLQIVLKYVKTVCQTA